MAVVLACELATSRTRDELPIRLMGNSRRDETPRNKSYAYKVNSGATLEYHLCLQPPVTYGEGVLPPPWIAAEDLSSFFLPRE